VWYGLWWELGKDFWKRQVLSLEWKAVKVMNDDSVDGKDELT